MFNSYKSYSLKLKSLTTAWLIVVFFLLSGFTLERLSKNQKPQVFYKQNIDKFCLNGKVTTQTPPHHQSNLTFLNSVASSSSIESPYVRKSIKIFVPFYKSNKTHHFFTFYSKILIILNPSRAPPLF